MDDGGRRGRRCRIGGGTNGPQEEETRCEQLVLPVPLFHWFSLFFFKLATVSGPPLFVSLPTINERATGSAIFSPQKNTRVVGGVVFVGSEGFHSFF